ncbi:MAG: fatty acid desaturase, partial [Planctomycetota bacterium]
MQQPASANPDDLLSQGHLMSQTVEPEIESTEKHGKEIGQNESVGEYDTSGERTDTALDDSPGNSTPNDQEEPNSLKGSDELRDPQQFPPPESAQPLQLMWTYVAVLSVIHLLALPAVLPFTAAYCFTWSGLIVGIGGHFLFGMMGITIGYHRLLTHKGFQCPKWFERTLALLGTCNLQDSPARWVAIHRMHHQHSDHQPDPHSPLVNFVWGHVGWVVYRNRDIDTTTHFQKYAKDLLRQPFYLNLERKGMWFLVYAAHATLITLTGSLVGYLIDGTFASAYQYGVSWFVWGVAMRTVFVLHGTWSVNSLGHMFGYRNYQTRDASRNNWLNQLLRL